MFSFVAPNQKVMNKYDVIIIGGSYAGLSAAMALGRSLRKVLIIDAGQPCNRQTPHSHNFLTQDGQTPANISAVAKAQVLVYPTVKFFDGMAVNAHQDKDGFTISTADGQSFASRKLILTTGIKDIFPTIPGFAECWGITVLHCPYCHGYEVANQPLGVIANGEMAFEFGKMIHNWSNNLILFTNGASTLNDEQTQHFKEKNIQIVSDEIAEIVHEAGIMKYVLLKNGTKYPLKSVFGRGALEQHNAIAEQLGCELDQQNLVKVNEMQQTSVAGVFAGGDCTTLFRTVAGAVAQGNKAGVGANKELIEEDF